VFEVKVGKSGGEIFSEILKVATQEVERLGNLNF